MDKKRIRVVSAAIKRDGRYLITQRQEKAVLPLLWEFPGGKVEGDESDAVALRRELTERLCVDAKVAEHISSTEREYDKYIVELHLYRCEIGDTQPRVGNIRALKWVGMDEIEAVEFTPADQKSMDALLFSRAAPCLGS